jgi:alanyl-tRNA synthetase
VVVAPHIKSILEDEEAAFVRALAAGQRAFDKMVQKGDFVVTGRVTDGRKVVAGVLFTMWDRHGLSPSDTLGLLLERGMVPDIVDFVASAQQAGWGRRRIIGELVEAWRFVSLEDAVQVKARIEALI